MCPESQCCDVTRSEEDMRKSERLHELEPTELQSFRFSIESSVDRGEDGIRGHSRAASGDCSTSAARNRFVLQVQEHQ
jgi:hypothetical protein